MIDQKVINAIEQFVGSDQHNDALRLLKPAWCLDANFDFKENTWKLPLKDAPNIQFDVAIAPHKSLVDDYDLLNTCKKLVVLASFVPIGPKGVLGAEGCLHFVENVINFLRVINLHYGLTYFSSVSTVIAQKHVSDLASQPLFKRLDIHRRLEEYLASLDMSAGSDDFIRLLVKRRTRKSFDFSYNAAARALGVSSRLLQKEPMATTILKFKGKHNLYISASQCARLNQVPEIKTEKLSPDAIRKYLNDLKRAFKLLSILPTIFPESQRLPPDQLVPFSATKISKISRKNGSKEVQTRDIPQPVFFQAMDVAIRWVVDYSDDILALRERAYAQYGEFLSAEGRGGTEENQRHYAMKKMRLWAQSLPGISGHGAPSNIVAFEKDTNSGRERSISDDQIRLIESLHEQGHKHVDIGNLVGLSKASVSRILNQGRAKAGVSINNVAHHYLPTACFMVIYAFTARREGEVEGLTEGCCFSTLNGEYIRMYSEKVLEAYQDFPTTKLVHKAVEVLEKLTDTIGGKGRKLARFPTMHNREVEYWSYNKINDFCEYVGVDSIDEDGKPFSWSEHQFRRFFAMTYFYKFDGGNLSTLSWHLRHTTMDMTVKYITDPAFRTAYDSVRLDKILEVAKESRHKFSGQIKVEIEQIIESFEPQKGARVERMQRDKIGELGLVLNFVADGLCFGDSPNIRARSKCLTAGSIQLSSAYCGSCNGCSNLVALNESGSIEELQTINVANSPMFFAAEKAERI